MPIRITRPATNKPVFHAAPIMIVMILSADAASKTFF